MTDKKTWFRERKNIALIIIGLGTVWMLYMLRTILSAFILGALFAYLLSPIARLVTQRSGMSRPVAAKVVFVIFLLIFMAVPAFLGKVAMEQLHILEVEFVFAITAFEKWISQPVEVFGHVFHPGMAAKDLDKIIRDNLASIPEISLNILSIFTSNLFFGAIFVASFYHLLVDGHKLGPWIKKATPGWDQTDLWRLLDEMNKVWGVFLRVQLLMFVILGVMMGAGFLIVIWLFRSGLIPFSPLALIALVILVVTIAQQIDNLWLRPQLMGKSLLLHPWFIFVGLTATLITGNFLAVFLVVPVMASVKILGRYFHLRLLGLAPWPDVPKQY